MEPMGAHHPMDIGPPKVHKSGKKVADYFFYVRDTIMSLQNTCTNFFLHIYNVFFQARRNGNRDPRSVKGAANFYVGIQI